MDYIIMGCLVIYCLVCSYTDITTRRIPNKLTYLLIFILLLLRIQCPTYYLSLIPALLFFIVYLVNPNSIGAGDIKMLAAIGLGVGGKMIMVIFGMCLSSVLYYFFQKVLKKSVKSIPLAPFISIGVLFVVPM